jgi:hypothetical protein
LLFLKKKKVMSEGGGIAATNSGVVETANDSTLKPWLLPNVSVENRKSDEDEGDNMSLESGEEQQQQGVHDDSSDDDALYDDLDDEFPTKKHKHNHQELEKTLNEINGANHDTFQEAGVKPAIDAKASFGESILQLLLDVVGLDNGSNSTYSSTISIADPITACSTLSQKVLRQLQTISPSVATTDAILNSISCAFVQCAALIMSASISTNTATPKPQNLENNNSINQNRGYTAATQPTPLVLTAKEDDHSHLCSTASLTTIRQSSMMTLIGILTYFISNLGTSSFIELIFPPIPIDENILEESLLGAEFKLDAVFLALTRVRNILEPMLMHIIPILTRWHCSTNVIDAGSPSSSNSPGTTVDSSITSSDTTKSLRATKKRRKLAPFLDNAHALTLKKHLITLGEIHWKLDSSCTQYCNNIETARNEGNLLRSNMIHLFLIDLATQQMWSFRDVGLIPRVLSLNVGQLELSFESEFSFSFENERNPHCIIVDMHVINTWLTEVRNKTLKFTMAFAEQTIKKTNSLPQSAEKGISISSSVELNKSSTSSSTGPSSRWDAVPSATQSKLPSNTLASPLLLQKDLYGGSFVSKPEYLPSEVEKKAQLLTVSAGSTNTNNNGETKTTLPPISTLNQWYQQGFGISSMKKNLQAHGDNFSWTCVLVCPITRLTFPAGHYGPNFVTDPQTGVVWHSSRKEAEHAAAARMVDSLAAVQHCIPPGFERLALSPNHRYCSDEPLPVDLDKYIRAHQRFVTDKAVKYAVKTKNNNS